MGHVNDGEASMRQSYVALRVDALTIGASMHHAGIHLLQQGFIVPITVVTGDSAHTYLPHL